MWYAWLHVDDEYPRKAVARRKSNRFFIKTPGLSVKFNHTDNFYAVYKTKQLHDVKVLKSVNPKPCLTITSPRTFIFDTYAILVCDIVQKIIKMKTHPTKKPQTNNIWEFPHFFNFAAVSHFLSKAKITDLFVRHSSSMINPISMPSHRISGNFNGRSQITIFPDWLPSFSPTFPNFP